MRKLLLRIPFFRWCALQHLLQVRHKRQEAAWFYTQSILVALGNITISWAGINLILNTFIEAHHNHLGRPIRKDIPMSFTGKLEYMKKAERDPRWNPGQLAKFRLIRLELAKLNEKRVNITHGLLLRRGYGPEFTIHIAKESGDNLMRKNIPYSGQDIIAFGAELSHIGRKMSEFFGPLVGRR